ncbi:hypothetical protein WA026_014022 [Henosepilachna vigintioctopunctata]|uniref:Translation initiation factor 3 N-terminal domain-containing protein n=1 Tax=Henosepilachna vigintioctopunctata TaxID=420089 RepID=A0AAW1UBH9_9CUCU
MSLVTMLIRNSTKNLYVPLLSSYQLYFPSNSFHLKESTTTQEKPVQKKTVAIPKITLIFDNNLIVTTFEDAQKLSKRRDLKLVKIIDLDTKTKRPVYKLMTGTEYHQEDLKQRLENKKLKKEAFIKGEKLLMLKDNIAEHDLESYGNKILKWLSKSYQVNAVISSSNANMEKTEKVFSNLVNFLKDEGRILQKRIKGADLKFQIVPPKREKKEEL